MTPSKDDVRQVLGEYHSRIRGVVERAWNEWRLIAAFMVDQRIGPVLYSRTIANFVFDAIARNAVAEFGPDDSVHVKIEAQTVKFIFKGAVLARFKKGDENKLGQNIPTQAAMAFVDAEGIFPGLPPETARVEFVWLPNEIHTKLDDVLVVARDNDRRLWQYAIAAEGGAGEVTAIPSHPPAPDGDDDGLVRPKVPDEQDAENE